LNSVGLQCSLERGWHLMHTGRHSLASCQTLSGTGSQ